MPTGASASIDGGEKFAELSALERRILALTVRGYSTRESASKLGISATTVERHLSRVRGIFRVSNPLELVLFALHYRLVDSD